MKYIINNSNNAYYNVALEEYAFKYLEDEIFILWINANSIILGKYQNALEEIDKNYTKEHNINVVRRISGGGAVYHDLGNINYSIISNKKHDKPFDFALFSLPVINALKKLGVNAVFHGRNDIEIEGQKICGNAQAYSKNRLLHHGCLLYDVDLSILSKALVVSKDKIESKGIKSVRARVTNIRPHLKVDLDANGFKEALMNEMKESHEDFCEYKLSQSELAKIDEIAKYKESWEWNWGEAPKCSIRRDRKFPSAKLSILIDVQNSIINDIHFYGDFFSAKDTQDLILLLKGKRYEKEEIDAALKDIKVEDFIAGVDASMLSEALVD